MQSIFVKAIQISKWNIIEEKGLHNAIILKPPLLKVKSHKYYTLAIWKNTHNNTSVFFFAIFLVVITLVKFKWLETHKTLADSLTSVKMLQKTLKRQCRDCLMEISKRFFFESSSIILFLLHSFWNNNDCRRIPNVYDTYNN